MKTWMFIIVTIAMVRTADAGRVLPHPMDDVAIERAENTVRQRREAIDEGRQRGLESGVNTGITWGRWAVGAVVDGRELLDAYHGLTSNDTSCMDVSTLGAPEVPTSCGENDASCSQCYRDAYRELGEARFKLEKLRCIYTATKRFADKAIAFGDSASGIHAVTGLAWQEQKRLIEKSVDELNKSYDGKYNEFIPKLKTALEHVGTCETQFFNERDWYMRFGYIYFTFMSDRYKRTGK